VIQCLVYQWLKISGKMQMYQNALSLGSIEFQRSVSGYIQSMAINLSCELPIA